MAKDFPGIEVLTVAADFTQPFKLPNPRVMLLRNFVYLADLIWWPGGQPKNDDNRLFVKEL